MMDDERACVVTPEMRRIERRRRFIADIKWAFYRRAHALFWRTLHLTRLARPYGRTMCRMGWYRKNSMSGRCDWCGEVH